MSAKATFWAWEQHGISSSNKLVLLCLANCHNDDTGRCDPGAKYIHEQTGLNIKTIPSALKSLQKSGLIVVKNRAGKSPNYQLNIPQYRVTPKTGVPKNGSTTKNGVGVTPKTGTPPPPKTGDEPISESKKNLENIYKGFDLEKIPTQISTETAKEYIDHRAKIKKPLSSDSSLARVLNKAVRVSEDPQINMTSDEALHTAIDNGWQGLEISWLRPKSGQGFIPQQTPTTRKAMPIAGSEK